MNANSVEIAIRNDIAPTPSLSVGLSSGKIGPGEAVEAVAVASNIGTDGLKYEWYMDGIKLDASGSSIELEYEDVGSGIHTISCLISNSEGVLWSDSAEIDGGEDEPGYIPTYGTSETHPYLAITEDGAIYCIDKSIREANIPDYFNGTRVASFAPAAFRDCNRLESVTIPKTITKIGECIPDYCHITKIYDGSIYYEELYRIAEESMENGVFAGCTSLKAVEIPESVTTVGAFSFFGCSSLSDVKLPSKLESICMGTFAECSDLETITIPDSVTEIGYGAFFSCPSLSSIIIPDSVISLGALAFADCASLSSITIPDSVTEIGDDAFIDCSSLTEITIPDSVTEIGGIFFYCSSLNSITIPNSVTYIGNDAFYGCSSLEFIYINNEIFSIPGMPWGATNATVYWNNEIAETHPYLTINSDGAVRCIDQTITEATIPEYVNGAKVTSIDDYAFEDCSSLTEITIPYSVTDFGRYAFSGCSSLKSIYINNEIFSIPGMPWGATNATVYWNNEIAETHPYLTIDSDGAVSCTNKTITEAVIPEYVNGVKVTSIDDYAFRYCSSLTSITIPDSVTSIGYESFRGCSSLTEITIPNSVTKIGYDAFYGCSSLETIYINQYEGSLDISDAGIPSGVVVYWKTE